MRQSVHLGRVGGIDIGAHWSVIFIGALLAYGLATIVLPSGAPGHAVIVYLLVAGLVAVLFLAGLLCHELAHALVARHYGVGVKRITLWLLGGVSELDADPPTPRAELLVAAAGPVTSLAIGAAATGGTVLADVAGAGRLLIVALAWLAGVNLLLGVFNLLPGAPLDGGRIVRAVVWSLRHDRYRAQVAADRAGVVVGVVLIAAGVLEIATRTTVSGLWLVLLGWFLIGAANAEAAAARVQRALGGRRVRDIMTAEPVCGLDYQTVEAFVSGTAAWHPHRSYPVVDLDQRVVGVVRLARLGRIPAAHRAELPLRAVATSIADVAVVGPEEPAWAAARRLSTASPLVVVADYGQLVGVVSTGDMARAVELSDLGHSSQAGDARRA